MQEFKFRHNSCALLGDTHSTYETYSIISTRVQEGTDIVILGDFGIGFGLPSYALDNALSWLDKINKLCTNLNINAYFIAGNHDNTSPRIWDSKWSNIFPIKNHAYATFPNGKKALLLGGAISIDRCLRKHNYDYWFDEGTSPIENVEKCDIVFSHDCPEQFNHSSHTIPTHWKNFHLKDPTLYDDCVKQRAIVGDIINRTRCKSIHYGHFHNNMTQMIDGVYARCVDINELYFFDAEHNYKL